jgi:hypothetical protein
MNKPNIKIKTVKEQADATPWRFRIGHRRLINMFFNGTQYQGAYSISPRDGTVVIL